MPYLTCEQNVRFAQRAARGHGRRPPDPAAILDDVGLLGRRRAVPAELAPGERQRLAFAVALAARPGLLLLDEPTNQLDEHSRDEVLEVLDRLHAAGTTVVVVTHDVEVGAALGRTVTIRDGRVGARAGAERTTPWWGATVACTFRRSCSTGCRRARLSRSRLTPTAPSGSYRRSKGEPMSRTIVVDEVTVAYGSGEPVLTGVSAIATPGQVLAVTGPSGAGKTTLLWTMAGLLRPSAGGVTVDGEPVRDRDFAVAQQIVLVPQDNGLAAILTAAENVQVALIAGGVTPPEARRRTAEALERLGLAGQSDQLVEELSGGQQQRTAIARGLALHGDVVLADEVTSELDATNRQKVIDLLREEAFRGAAVVFATHDPEAAAACDAELHLVDGRAELVRGPALAAG